MMISKKCLSIFSVAGALLLSATGFGRPITILHTNDMHTQFLPEPAVWVKQDPKPLIGGMKALSGYLKELRDGEVVLLDAGDMMTGTLISAIEDHGVKGGGFIRMANRLHYDASVIGNHEFDNGFDNLKKVMKLSNFPWLSANLYVDDTLLTSAYRIIRRNGLTIGIIGLTTDGLYGLVSPKHLKGMTIHPVPETAQKMIDAVDPQTDLIILLTHEGFEVDSALAASIQNVDVIVGGHSHTRLPSPRVVNDVIIVQTGARCQNLGKLNLEVNADTITSFNGSLVPLWESKIDPDPVMAALVDSFKTVIDEAYGKQIGTLKTEWKQAYSTESNLGNFITDAMRITANADFAVVNSGGIRKNLEKGSITLRDIYEILPFQNDLVSFECTGEELLKLIETNTIRGGFEQGGILQVSGIKYAYKIENKEIHVIDASVNGEMILPEKMYTGVTVDYVASDNAMRYMGFKPRAPEPLDLLLADVVVDYIKEHPSVSNKIEGRIVGK